MGDVFNVYSLGWGLLSAVVCFLSKSVKLILSTYMLQDCFVPDQKQFGFLQLNLLSTPPPLLYYNLWNHVVLKDF